MKSENLSVFVEGIANFFKTVTQTPASVGTPFLIQDINCLLYTSPSPRDLSTSRMPSSA